jgi:hypothetical protein
MTQKDKKSMRVNHVNESVMPVGTYRILEWTSVFIAGTSLVEHEVQCPTGHGQWTTVHKCKTLAEARRWLLDCVPEDSCGVC